MPAWSIVSWPVLVWQSPWGDLPFKHTETSIADVQPRDNHLRGQTMWSCMHDNKPVGIAWEWIEVRHRVIALADPMCILSNLHFVTPGGGCVTESERALALNRIVYALNWQGQIKRVLRELLPCAA